MEESAVLERYSKASEAREAELCCPVNYNPQYLKVLPEGILERDYGCGDPSQYITPGETVLDLGSGGGKICYIASQVVGPRGKVIGVDFNKDMLALARKYQKEVSARIGWNNVTFLRGKIQNLQTDFDLLDKQLAESPLKSADDYAAFDERSRQLALENPMIADESIDIIVSNCVLNLVRTHEKRQLFREMIRVLKRGGRVAISDIVSDEAVPPELQADPELWSGCLSGAFQEKEFLNAFAEVGFYGIQIEKRDEDPWKTINGIEFRSMTVTAFKGKEGPCWEHNQAVIYKGPWSEVRDDDNHVLKRGERTAVCEKTFHIFSKAPYQEHVILMPPRVEISKNEHQPFDCSRSTERHPKETKGQDYRVTTEDSCAPGSSCC